MTTFQKLIVSFPQAVGGTLRLRQLAKSAGSHPRRTRNSKIDVSSEFAESNNKIFALVDHVCFIEWDKPNWLYLTNSDRSGVIRSEI
jgi:hypothetical protein